MPQRTCPRRTRCFRVRESAADARRAARFGGIHPAKQRRAGAARERIAERGSSRAPSLTEGFRRSRIAFKAEFVISMRGRARSGYAKGPKGGPLAQQSELSAKAIAHRRRNTAPMHVFASGGGTRRAAPAGQSPTTS